MAKKKKEKMHISDEGAMVPLRAGIKQYKAEGGEAKVLPKEDPAKMAEMKRRYYKGGKGFEPAEKNVTYKGGKKQKRSYFNNTYGEGE